MGEVNGLWEREDFSFPTLFYIAPCFTWFHIDGDATRIRKSKNAAHPLFYWMKAAFPVFTKWWRRRDSNSRPPRCERDALPTELLPRGVKTADMIPYLRRARKWDFSRLFLISKKLVRCPPAPSSCEHARTHQAVRHRPHRCLNDCTSIVHMTNRIPQIPMVVWNGIAS